MLKLGVREFRERLSEVANGNEFVVVTNNGREVGTYMPRLSARDIAAARQAEAEINAAKSELCAQGIDLTAVMARLGMTPEGDPLHEN